MTSRQDIMTAEERCHAAKDFNEYDQCLSDLNALVGQFLTERFGNKGYGCDRSEFDSQKIGSFIEKTMAAIGLSIDDISDIHLECEMGTRNVFALETKDGNKIWIKARGSNRPLTVTEMVITNEVSNLAEIVGEDVPHIVYQDIPHRLMAISNVAGKPIHSTPTVYNNFSPTEMATNTIFEIILMDADRIRDNVRNSDGIISEIDFAAIRPISSLQEWRNSKAANGLQKRLFNDLDSIASGKPPMDREWTANYVKSMKQKLSAISSMTTDIHTFAPNISKWNMERSQKILSETMDLLNDVESHL